MVSYFHFLVVLVCFGKLPPFLKRVLVCFGKLLPFLKRVLVCFGKLLPFLKRVLVCFGKLHPFLISREFSYVLVSYFHFLREF